MITNTQPIGIVIIMVFGTTIAADAAEGPWAEERAVKWYNDQDWVVGANYVPRTAINQLEMWQAETFDPAAIDQEFGWSADTGFNCMLVFLHDLLWQQDLQGLMGLIVG